MLVDDVVVKQFKSAFLLRQSVEFTVPDSEDIILLRFLPDTVEFEVFYNNTQIDNSETSSKSVVKGLKWTFGFMIGWNLLVLLFINFSLEVYKVIQFLPSALFTDPAMLYGFTSTLTVFLLFLAGRILLEKGIMLLYRICVAALIIDITYSLYFLVIYFLPYNSGFTFFLWLAIPGAVKGITLASLIKGYKKYEEFCKNVNHPHNKGNEDTLDI